MAELVFMELISAWGVRLAFLSFMGGQGDTRATMQMGVLMIFVQLSEPKWNCTTIWLCAFWEI